MTAEQTLAFYPSNNSEPLTKRRVIGFAAMLVGAILLASSCSGDKGNGGGGSPIDTDGTRGSGYRPAGGWPGDRHYPQGLERFAPTPADSGDAVPRTSPSDTVLLSISVATASMVEIMADDLLAEAQKEGS